MSIFLGICLIGFAAWISFVRKKKQFNRRNQAGIEEFKSYEHSLQTNYVDKMVNIIAGILALAGFGLIIYGLYAP